MLAAGLVFVGTHLLSRGVAGFARANILIVAAAIFVAVLLLREYRKLTASPKESGS
jgi:asparagine N-glycosylation enzyme membrane subunit Stt3